ncbi:MAG: tRNA 2-selenouridine(34) synthase MnmH [Cetobacterium sp.]|uniref:tRNA 2-selenouridine(34) synthase MnmH n=2 Tax=unclassified Cetobacterium TaxID=2630983 RepID=UPI002FC6C788
MNLINFERLLKEKNYTLIDVRTPKEFAEESIPGAINVPLLLDDERVDVGTAYKQISPEKAKELGIRAIAKRLPDMFKEIQALSSNGRLVFYCARGGMRSGSVAALFSVLGYNCWKLEGGYKAYRSFVLENIPKVNEGVKYIILHGKTGIGKTRVLQKLDALGYSVLDLEKMADHKGSFFGALCESRPQSQKRFESLVFHFLQENKPEYVLAESESKRIGNVYVPESIFESLSGGRHLALETTIEERVKIIMDDYSEASDEDMKNCIEKVGRYADKKDFNEYLNLFNEGKLPELAKILMLKYYDPLYQKSIDKYDYDAEINYENLDEAVEKIEKYLNSQNIFPKL